MNGYNWWGRLGAARLRLDMLLQACAPALIARATLDEAGACRAADRLSTVLEGSARIAEDVLRSSSH